MHETKPVIAIEVWHWPLAGSARRQQELFETLSEDERARAGKFRDAADAAAYVSARGGLREILAASRMGDAKALRFAYGQNGKPRLAGQDRPPYFNLSHSGGFAACAVCASHEVGIDIERLRPIEQDVARHFFSPIELQELGTLQPVEWLRGFFNCWVRKEAVVKAIGSGLSTDLSSFDVTLRPGQPARLLRLDGEPDVGLRWHLAELRLEAGFAGAIACRSDGQPVTVTVRRWR